MSEFTVYDDSQGSMPKPSSIRPVVSTQCHNGNVTSAGWQVTLCDPMWHASSRSGVATMRTAIHFCYLLTYLQYRLVMDMTDT